MTLTDGQARDLIWTSIETLVPVRRVLEMPAGLRAAYQSSPDPKQEYVMVPQGLDDILEATLLAHELGHVVNKRNEPVRWESYIEALNRWQYAATPPATRGDALLIYLEESIAEERGRKFISIVSAELVPHFDSRAEQNLKAYRIRLGL